MLYALSVVVTYSVQGSDSEVVLVLVQPAAVPGGFSQKPSPSFIHLIQGVSNWTKQCDYIAKGTAFAYHVVLSIVPTALEPVEPGLSTWNDEKSEFTLAAV